MSLNFQTRDIPTDSKIFTFPNYVDNNFNMFVGLSMFFLDNKQHYKFNITMNPTNLTINIDSSYNFSRIVFRNLHFMALECPSGKSLYDEPTNLCYDTSCPIRTYYTPTPISCQPCLYDCASCANNTACFSCNATTNYRQLDPATKRCLPLPGYYDDGTNNIVAMPCSSPCSTCTGSANYC
jgi:hypothetical protein